MVENPAYQARKFSFDEDIVEEFTHGECWHLAAALSARLKMPYAIILGDGVMHHAAIELPNGNIVDIEGVWEEGEWSRHWYEELQDVWEIESGYPIKGDEHYELLYPKNDNFENYAFGPNNTPLKEIADQIAQELGY